MYIQYSIVLYMLLLLVTTSTQAFLPSLAKILQCKHKLVLKQNNAFSLETFLCEPGPGAQIKDQTGPYVGNLHFMATDC